FQGLRYLLVDGSFQSCAFRETMESCFGYVHVLPEYAEENASALLIGLGAGSLAREMEFEDAVEIDPMVFRAAHDYFGYPGTAIFEDGRAYLRQTQKKYDTIVMDAFSGYNPAAHLYTKEFFALAKSRMNPGGRLIINTVGTDKGEIQSDIYSTLKTEYANVAVLKLKNRFPNYIFIASESPIEGNFTTLPPGEIITDDYNTVEFKAARISIEWRDLNHGWIGEHII
ncbi:MAG: fused MFS/spermidine synthase, partial [Nanoarchaeota archaeon]|nr:fused MFS/spermidine synthase [Nanoarchaeota archaeon]